MKRPKCAACGKPISKAFSEYTERQIGMATPVHSQACAMLLVCRITVAVPGIVELLPPQWQHAG